MTSGYGRGYGFLPRPKVGKHKSTAADADNDVKRREAVYREGQAAAYAECLDIVGVYGSKEAAKCIEGAMEEAARRIEEAMNG